MNKAAKLNRDLDIELGDCSLLRGTFHPSIRVLLHFDKGTICQIKNHFDEGKSYGHVDISFQQSFGNIVLSTPDTWIEEV
jgi:hypothetical protein